MRQFAAALGALIALCASACAVPLAPGYKILKESREVRFVAGQPAALDVHALYTLQNSGTADLAFLDVALPAERTYGRTDLRVQVDGKEATAENLPPVDQPGQPDALRIPLDPAWGRGKARQLSVEYTLRSPGNSGSRITIGDTNFHLASRGWFPELQPPKRVLSPYPASPKAAEFSVRVPADFLLLAGGVPKGQKKAGEEVEYRFELTASTTATYVVAGRYSAWPAQRKSESPIFWTLQPMQPDAAAGAQQIGSVWAELQKDFGPLDKNVAAPHIVESAELRSRINDDPAAPAAVAFPGGAIVNPAALALGTGSDEFLRIVSHALAQEWFGESMYLSDAAAVGMGEGLPEYATIVIDEARSGPDARHRRVTEYLRRFDEASKAATETPLSAIVIGDPVGPRRIALAKAPLFFVALEDVCGEGPMRAGLSRMLATQRGREAGYADLRSALEESCSRNFAPMFRLWLNSKGIPPDFRLRYQGSAAGDVAELR